MSEEKESALDVQVGGDHYKKYKIQPKVFLHANAVPHIEAQIIEYVLRWRDKNGFEDLDKAKHLIDLLKELEGKANAQRDAYINAMLDRGDSISDEPG